MIARLNILLSVIAAFFLAALNGEYLFFIIVLIPVFYFASIKHAFYEATERLLRLESLLGRKRRPENSQTAADFSVGGIDERFRTVELKINKLLNEFSAIKARRTHTLLSHIEPSASERSLRLLPDEALELSSAFCCAIGLWSSCGDSTLYFNSGAEKRLCRIVEALFTDYHESGEIKEGELIELSSSTRLLESALVAQGFQYRIAIKIPFKQVNKLYTQGLLWLGYQGGSRPLNSEITALKKFAAQIEDYIRTLERVNELDRRAALAEQENKDKSDFLAYFSHDLRSPLNNIRTILELILLECNDPEKAEMVETAINNCGDVSDLLEDILAFSRYQAGKLTANKEIFNIVSCVSECAERFKISARARGLELSVDSEVDFRMVEADRKHVKRIISNLIGNAVKYTKFGSINVSVADCGNRIAVGIRDTGCGMTAEEVGRIFKPFERGALSGEERGTGLGLALSKVLTELNGGTIDVKSSPGKGSLFTLYLKRAQAESLAEAEMRAEDPLKYRDINILLVDDDSDLVRSLALGLKAAGLNVFTAVTVHDAESIMNFERIDLLISDAGMPDGGGERLVRYIKSQQPESRVIVMTGSDDSAISQTMYRLGADELFIKPVDFENILGWVRQTMAEEAGREVRSVRA